MQHKEQRRLIVLAVCLLSAPIWAQKGTSDSVLLPSLSGLVDSVKGAVVNVEVTVSRRAAGDFLRDDGRGPQASGSGFIIDSKGLVLTNNHVIEKAASIRVRLADGRAFVAQVAGRDPLTDLALLRLKGKVENLPVAKLGNSDLMKAGDWVFAIGNPFGLNSSVSLGIISAQARDMRIGPYDEFIQTDAAINPGNSGGPLFNLKGEVIGINTAIISGGGGGLGFAVPTRVASALLPLLEKEGVVSRGWMGIGIQDLTRDLARALELPETEGAIVTGLTEKGPGALAGLREDDVITAFDGEPISSGGALIRQVALRAPGTVTSLNIYRSGAQKMIRVTLGKRPDLEGIGEVAIPKDEGVSPTPRLGLVIRDHKDNEGDGVLVTEVAPGTAAERAGLEKGMVIFELQRKPVKTTEEFVLAVRKAKSGQALLLRTRSTGGKSLRALVLP